MDAKSFFTGTATNALLQILNVIVYILRLPLDLWMKAITRLSEQKENGIMKLSEINSPWPYLSFVKRLCFDFILDAAAILSYPIGLLFALYQYLKSIFVAVEHDFFNGEAFLVMTLGLIGALIGVYLTPMIIALVRDLLQFLLLPIYKIISWLRKPAQQLDIDLKNRA